MDSSDCVTKCFVRADCWQHFRFRNGLPFIVSTFGWNRNAIIGFFTQHGRDLCHLCWGELKQNKFPFPQHISSLLLSCNLSDLLYCLLGLLYQEYRDKSTRQEIETRRLQDSQTDPEESSPSEETPPEAEPTNTTENKAPPQISLLRNSNSRFNLWQDLPEIRSSGVLSILKPDEIKLQEVMGEGGVFLNWLAAWKGVN